MGHQTGCETLRTRTPVTIKGIRDGLVFILHDECSMEEILEDLEEKVNGTHSQLLAGPLIKVTIQTGNRKFSAEQEAKVRQTLSSHGNLIIQEFLSAWDAMMQLPKPSQRVHYGTVRSGQVIEHDGDVVVIGDINPGGQVLATGDIFVMGTLRGMAHAGCKGNEEAVIAAVFFQPSQLRIHDVISRAPDTGETQPLETEMEFAYLRERQMAVDKLSHLYSIRARD
ncbi:septum site-determining protein MinC [Tumebacillus sp. BK434]|uniref:septum site-determining protein MinC n=1 Tax=Tumebacillus sp. BK434 TaxID=2512169 RepID=UPI001042BE7A|nr:septum site-determining protein MinC [Tumebacillus sp. BK434]